MKKIITLLAVLTVCTSASFAVPIFSTSNSDSEKIDIEPTKTEAVKKTPKLKASNNYFATSTKTTEGETNSTQFGEILLKKII